MSSVKAVCKGKYLTTVFVCLASAGLQSALADSYPVRPVRFIVPFPAGGGTDTVARLIASPLAERLGQPVVVDNRGGANAIIGTDLGAKAPPDGHTLTFCLPASVAVNPTLYRDLPYDPPRDFLPVIQLNTIAIMLVAANTLPVKSVAELIAYAKSRPGQLNFASSGRGSAGHLSVELLSQSAGLRMVHVAYKGGSPALSDTIAGQMHLMAGPMISAIPHIKSGRVKGLAVMAPVRAKVLPDVEAMGETIPGFNASIWHGVLVPRGTPAAVVERLNRDLNSVLSLRTIADRMAQGGSEVVGGSPAAFAEVIRADAGKYSRLLTTAGMAGSAKR